MSRFISPVATLQHQRTARPEQHEPRSQIDANHPHQHLPPAPPSCSSPSSAPSDSSHSHCNLGLSSLSLSLFGSLMSSLRSSKTNPIPLTQLPSPNPTTSGQETDALLRFRTSGDLQGDEKLKHQFHHHHQLLWASELYQQAT